MMMPSTLRFRANAMLGLVAGVAVLEAASASHGQAADPAPTPLPSHKRVEYLTPHPPYPTATKMQRLEGKVTVRITWAAKDNVEKVVVVKSSGSRILDDNATDYSKANWRCFLGKTITHTTTGLRFPRFGGQAGRRAYRKTRLYAQTIAAGNRLSWLSRKPRMQV